MKVFALFCAAAAAAGAGVTAVDENIFAVACDNKKSGDSCSFTQPSGTTTSGTCFSPASPSACGPGFDGTTTKCVMCGEAPASGGGAGGNTTAKAMPATTACATSSVGDACAFVGADGTKNTGKCADEGAGACGPGYETTDTPCYVCNTDTTAATGSTGGTVNSANNECSGKTIGDECVIVRGTDSISGLCTDTDENVDTGDGKMACSPVSSDTLKNATGTGSTGTTDPALSVSTVLTDACTSKSSGAVCSYVDPATNAKVTGTCASDGSRTSSLQCDNESSSGTGSTSGTATDPLVLACAKLTKGTTCTANFGVTTISGACATGEDGALYCSPVLTNAAASRSLRH